MYLGKIQSGKPLKKILFGFMFLVILAAGSAIYISTAKSVITVTPKQETISVDFELLAHQNPTNKNEIFGRQLIQETNKTITFEDVDTKSFPSQAHGMVTIYNHRDKDQPLLPSTQLEASNGMIFRTTKRAVAPAEDKVEVEVLADGPGEEGNIEPGRLTIVKIWAAWQDQIYAESTEQFTGGSEIKPFVNQATLDRAKEITSSQLFNEIKQKFKDNLQPGEILSDKSIKNEIVEFDPKTRFTKQFDNTEGSQTDKIVINIKVKTEAVTFNEAHAKEISEERLIASTPSGNEFLEVLPDNFNFKITDINQETGVTKITFHLEGNTRLKLPQKTFDKSALIGRNFGEIKNYYREISEVDNVEVFFTPFWVSSVPSGEEKIEVRVK